ncbi:MAG: glycosyltransferase family A protein [Bacteroidales bacterium]|nr:glycosyltransferase family A protein [Bacteroidales bacterium]
MERVLPRIAGSDDIKYSVIVPVYNVENYVGECLDSIISQRRNDLEVVVVDDGSTDSSGLICDEWQAAYPDKITVIHKPNEGLLLARRNGFAHSCGRYLISVDSDDMLMPFAIGAIDEALKCTNADVIKYQYTRRYSDYELNARSKNDDVHIKSYDALDKDSLLRLLCEGVSQNAMWAKAVRRECVGVDLDYSSFHGMTYAEDFLQTVVIYDRAETFYELNYPLYYYRPNPYSCTGGADYNPKHYQERMMALEAAETYARRWEQARGLDGLMRGLACQGLVEASRFAVFLAQHGLYDELNMLSRADSFRSRYTEIGATLNLRADRRLEAWLLFRRLFGLLRIEASMKRGLKRIRRK